MRFVSAGAVGPSEPCLKTLIFTTMYRDNLKGAAFWKSPRKAITLLGMSGVGKTTLASRLPRQTWFHYSGDYRIGTRYLDEPIPVSYTHLTLPTILLL